MEGEPASGVLLYNFNGKFARTDRHPEVSGSWFDAKINYSVISYCTIGDKITRTIYFSTFHIVCFSPISSFSIIFKAF